MSNIFLTPRDGHCFYTTSLYLAAYLCLRGLELIKVEHSSNDTTVFVFQDVDERNDLVHQFKYGPSAPVDARRFTQTLIDLAEQVRRSACKCPTIRI